MGRRAAAAKSFTAWAHRTGRLPVDVGARLASPRPDKTLPSVLRVDQAAAMLTPVPLAKGAQADEPAADGPDPVDAAVELRDQAILELLYASGIRVSELTGLDIADVDRHRRVLAGAGQGFQGAGGAVRGARRRRRRRLAGPWSGTAAPPANPGERCSSAAAAADGSARGTHPGARTGPRPSTARRRSRRTGCGTPRPPTCSRAARTCGPCRSCWVTPAWRPRRSTPTSPPNGSPPSTGRRIPGVTPTGLKASRPQERFRGMYGRTPARAEAKNGRTRHPERPSQGSNRTRQGPSSDIGSR